MNECPERKFAPPSRAGAAAPAGNQPVSGFGYVNWLTFDRTICLPVGADDVWLNQDESCLAQRFKSALQPKVGPAMIGNKAAADRISSFSDEDKGKSLKD